MKMKTLVAALCLAALPLTSFADTGLVNKAAQEAKQQQAHNVQREAGFKQTEKELAALRAQLVAKRNAIQADTDALAKQFSDNEDTLARLEEQLRLETGSLGELFGVVRQNAKELDSELKFSVISWDHNQYNSVVDEIVAAKSLPSMKQLQGLWLAMQDQINASAEVTTGALNFINGDGATEQVNAARIGAFGLVTEQGYVHWNGQRQDAIAYVKQPDNAPTLSVASQLASGETQHLALDPSRGIMLEQLAQEPTLADRFDAGGVVGKIIIALLLVGLGIALFRGASLSIARQKIRQQLKTPDQPGNNPLGRVLSVYNKEQNRSVEALELRLLEAVVDEQTGLERGLSMLKLLAALAPMLGLLGTVTGMIETFQVITQFGNGDPKVMAGGISMALVTTVLGLVAAMPLLLAHNILSSQAEAIRNILEKQGIGLVAAEAEKESATYNAKQAVGNAA
ncbi:MULTISPECIES: MotA/TolQ/ExbB proton channel family protein [unclassified Vibrio]|uniref:MotA/TolQ/ExbB proton channel family protein n=1 Tax=unclassified Vibrio TaxID=2614977 RepID=UPI001360FAFB|nr:MULTISPECIES: MotA/TolQ/ExbB proton channel family protein [unclassified Vibrio]NAW57208.1 flagellar motor protein MotA [Vibrio sp. V36_P2S2PM302]NAX26281.1 flagellar motor protein MotA [Vibrio sp. V38_P2S17PM301]NAX28547.1 flagellar motor protein MotA [Vibrio sp. V37_P2S8PM304]